MTSTIEDLYSEIRNSGSVGFYEQKRGLIYVRGSEAVQFLDGLITNDVKTLEDGAQMRAAFPNAQGRLIALVRVMRSGDQYIFETEEATHETLFNNLFRFTYAGDFFVEDMSDRFRYFSIFGNSFLPSVHPLIEFERFGGTDYFVHVDDADDLLTELKNNSAVSMTDELFETLRIENGIPLYGVDMDETTVVPELGIDGTISYNKGCYIGQEIIARIHFRGHVAKQLAGLVIDQTGGEKPAAGSEITTPEGKAAGRITSVSYSPALGKTIALAYIRYEHLAEGTGLDAAGSTAVVTPLPFIR
jgi:folate-binding protein YgfZ